MRATFLVQPGFDRSTVGPITGQVKPGSRARPIRYGPRPSSELALGRGKIDVNPCEKAGRLYSGTRADKIWTLDDEAAILKRAPAHLHLPLRLAVWTGQREGDLLRLPWSAYNGTHIRLRQSKGGRRVTFP